MSPGALRDGEWLAAVGAIVVLVALLALHWYAPVDRIEAVSSSLSGSARAVSVHHHALASVVPARTGWAAIPTLRWFVLVTAILGLGLAVAQAAARGPALPVTVDLIAMLAAGLTTVLLLVRLATTGAPLRFGAIVGLLGAGAISRGAFRAMRVERGWTPGPAHPIEIVGLEPDR